MAGAADLLALLVQRGWLPEPEARQLGQRARDPARAVIHAVRESGRISDRQLLSLYRDQLGLPEIDPEADGVVDLEALRWLTQALAEAELVLPVTLESREGERVMRLAMADPLNADSVRRVQEATGILVDPVLAEAGPLERAIARLYGRITTRLIPRPRSAGPADPAPGSAPSSAPGGSATRPGGGWSPGAGLGSHGGLGSHEGLGSHAGIRRGAGLEPETQPVHRLEDEATPAQMVQALVRVLERRGLLQHAEFVEELKTILRGDAE
jgi:hypothetical protein